MEWRKRLEEKKSKEQDTPKSSADKPRPANNPKKKAGKTSDLTIPKGTFT